MSDSVLIYARFGGIITRHSLEYLYYARLNSIHRFNLRQVEKNRFPHKCQCKVCGHHFLCQNIEELLQRSNVCWGCDAGNIIKRTAETLFHLVGAVPQWERDQLGIYPADFRYPRLPLWRQEKMVLPGPAYRGPKVEYWRRKWPSKECPALFDECDHKQKDAFQLEPQDAKKLASKERAEAWRVAKAGGSVIHLGSPAKRHANLASTMADYNEQWGSYTNNNTLSRTLRGLRSLNIPRETIELRNSMIDNLQRDFSRPDSTMAA